MAYAAVSKSPTSSPAPVREFAASDSRFHLPNVALTESKRQPESEAPSEPTTVIVHSRAVPSAMPLRPRLSLAGDPERLVRELQRELKRVGCYYQETDGEWGSATRRAAKDFTDRVNAVLPLDRPDPALLALLQSQTRITCGNTCPAGQSLTTDNRCVPSALQLRSSPPPMAAQSAL